MGQQAGSENCRDRNHVDAQLSGVGRGADWEWPRLAAARTGGESASGGGAGAMRSGLLVADFEGGSLRFFWGSTEGTHLRGSCKLVAVVHRTLCIFAVRVHSAGEQGTCLYTKSSLGVRAETETQARRGFFVVARTPLKTLC